MTGSRPAAALDPPDELVRRAAHGDEAAFARLVRLHNEAMTRVAFVVTGDRNTAADAAVAAWVEAWPGLRRRRSAVGLVSWLASLAAMRAVVFARGDRAGDSLALRAPVSSSSRDPVVTPAPDQVVDAGLEALLSRLDPEDRAGMALLHVAGLTPLEVDAVRLRSRSWIPVRLERLVAGLRGSPPPVSGADPSAASTITAPRLRAYALIPVPPIDADAIARRARAEAALERTRVVSVTIAACIGAVVALHPYLAMLLFRR